MARTTPAAKRFRTIFMAIAIIVAGGLAAIASPAQAAVTITVDSLTTSIAEPKPTDSLRATAVVRANSNITLQNLTVAVRNDSNGNFDFPGALTNVTIGTSQFTFNSGYRTLPGGNYTYFVAYRYGGVWTNLQPFKSLGSYTFRDEFETTGGFNTNIWHVDPCWSVDRCGNNELQQNSADNCWTDGNNLVLAAWTQANPDYPYASCRLTMLDSNKVASWSQLYGHFEARILSPTADGTWPAFWMVGSNIGTAGWPMSGEIDIFEALGKNPTIAEQHVHGGNPRFDWGGQWTFPNGQDISGWHTYSVDWNASGITWKIDGATVRSLSATTAGSAWAQSFQHPFTIIVNMAIGGYGGTPNPAEFPAYMKVAWVRAW